MPYTLTNDGEYLICRFSGRVTKDDIELLSNEPLVLETTIKAPVKRIVDFLGIETWEIETPELFSLIKKRRKSAFPIPIKSAILAQKAIDFEYARMIRTLNDNPTIEIQIFPNNQEAMAWLNTPPLA